MKQCCLLVSGFLEESPGAEVFGLNSTTVSGRNSWEQDGWSEGYVNSLWTRASPVNSHTVRETCSPVWERGCEPVSSYEKFMSLFCWVSDRAPEGKEFSTRILALKQGDRIVGVCTRVSHTSLREQVKWISTESSFPSRKTRLLQWTSPSRLPHRPHDPAGRSPEGSMLPSFQDQHSWYQPRSTQTSLMFF